jgi:hypothetical protein
MSLKLSDVKSRTIKAHITGADGYDEHVTIGSLSYTEWNNCAIGVQFPPVPTVRILTDKGMQDVFNYNDPTYRNELSIANAQVDFRRVVASLIKGGNFPELKDKSFDEQVEALGDADWGLIDGVLQVLVELKRHTKGGVETKKAAFQDGQLPENSEEHPETEAAHAG